MKKDHTKEEEEEELSTDYLDKLTEYNGSISTSLILNDVSQRLKSVVNRWSARLSKITRANSSHGSRKLLMSLEVEEAMTQYDLVKRTGMSPPAISYELSLMEAQGYIRHGEVKDNRSIRTIITNKGRWKVHTIRSVYQLIDQGMMKGITEEEKEALHAILRKMLLNLMKAEKQPVLLKEEDLY